MPYHIWDTPDYKDLDKKLWAVTKVATIFSTGMTFYKAFGNFLPPSGRAFLILYARSLVPNVAASNVGMLTAYSVAKARGNVDQHWNYLPAAVAFAGTRAALCSSGFEVGSRFAVGFLFGVVVIISKFGHNHRQGGYPRMAIGSEGGGDAFGAVRWRPSVENMPQDWGRRQ